MAPLRSSRSTRNQDHQAASRSRGTVELDPTEGLPVQKWEQMILKVNQDPSADTTTISGTATGQSATSSAEWSAQFKTIQYPWAESPLPSFFTQLPTWNQEMLRRARISNTKPKLSEWDRKTHAWLSAAEIEKRQNPSKSELLKNGEVSANNNGGTNAADENAEQEDDDEHEDQADDDMEVDHEEESGAQTRNVPSAKRRKHLAPEERTFEAKRWIQIPLAVAEKTEERRFLADRRPGMPSLYGGPYQNQVFMPLGLSQSGYTAYGTSNASYDLGDGTGLNTAVTQEQGAPAPVRRNIPPKRKKKSGPGRRKLKAGAGRSGLATQTVAPGIPGSAATSANAPASVTADQAQDNDIAMQDGEEESSDSGDSEGDGSEEGEIDEGNNINPGETLPIADAVSLAETTFENSQTDEPQVTATTHADTSLLTALIPAETRLEESVPPPLPIEADHVAIPVAPLQFSPMEEVMAAAPAAILSPPEAMISQQHPVPAIEVEPEPESSASAVQTDLSNGAGQTGTAIAQQASEPISMDPPQDEATTVPISALIDPVPEELEPITKLTDEPGPVPTGVAPIADILVSEPSVMEPEPVKETSPPIETEKSISPPDPGAPVPNAEPVTDTIPAPAPAPASAQSSASAIAPSSPEVPAPMLSPALAVTVTAAAATAETANPPPHDLGNLAPRSPANAEPPPPLLKTSEPAIEEHDLLGGLEDQLEKDMAS